MNSIHLLLPNFLGGFTSSFLSAYFFYWIAMLITFWNFLLKTFFVQMQIGLLPARYVPHVPCFKFSTSRQRFAHSDEFGILMNWNFRWSGYKGRKLHSFSKGSWGSTRKFGLLKTKMQKRIRDHIPPLLFFWNGLRESAGTWWTLYYNSEFSWKFHESTSECHSRTYTCSPCPWAPCKLHREFQLR